MNDSDVIAALATPSGKSALAIIRVSGKDSHRIIQKSIKEADKFEAASFNKIYRYNFIERESNRIIDDITAIKYKESKSYTGEEMVEIISHGNKIVVIEILDQIKKNGGRIAGRGEFTRRAFINGKMDIISAEYIQQKIDSSNEIQQKICRNLLEKNYEKILKIWEEEIKQIIVTIETEIEFNEEVEIEDDYIDNIKKIIEKIDKEKKTWETIRSYNKKLKITIAGPVNAGKSSLFNKLLGFNRSIVTDIPGTTRDTISETILIENNEIEIIDSAGIRETDDVIEVEGINRSKKEIDDANLVLWINSVDQEKILPPDYIEEKTIRINNKIDLMNDSREINAEEINVSIENEININSLFEEIKKRISKLKDIEIPLVIANERHFQISENIIESLKQTISFWNEKEKAAYYLYKTLDAFEEITGKRGKEEIYNVIFDKFCIGK